MASIENRSHHQVTVKNRDDLTKTFAHNHLKKAEAYRHALEAQGFKPKLSRLDNSYLIRDRSVTRAVQVLSANSKAEAKLMKEQIENEHKRNLFIDYASGYKFTLADLLIRYLKEIAPKLKSFEVIGYKINSMLEDAGLERQDIAAIAAAHPKPHAKTAAMTVRKLRGRHRDKKPCEATKFIRSRFADLMPQDFVDYIHERGQVVSDPTIDREMDIFSAVCNAAMSTWSIHVKEHPLNGVERPKYYNERDRRLKLGEEELLIAAACEEDSVHGIKENLERLITGDRESAKGAATVYRRKLIVKAARETHAKSAAESYSHSPLFEVFIQFQLMTGARRSETLSLTWANLDLEAQTAFFPETKNGRPRKVPIRRDLSDMLRELPRTNELVFPISIGHLRKAWRRICMRAGFVDEKALHIHDLRHEAISRMAEAGRNLPGGFSLIDLQHFSGHRDTRMLLRYAHLCTQGLAKQLDAAFANEKVVIHRGRRRIKARDAEEGAVSLSDVVNEAADMSMSANSYGANPCAEAEGLVKSKVIHVEFRRKAA